MYAEELNSTTSSVTPCGQNSCGLALVVLQQPTKPLAALQWACTCRVLAACRKEGTGSV